MEMLQAFDTTTALQTIEELMLDGSMCEFERCMVSNIKLAKTSADMMVGLHTT